MTTGERIKNTRKAIGMTQKELAAKLGVSFALISQYERNIRHPKILTLIKIADALNVTAAYLDGSQSYDLMVAVTSLNSNDYSRARTVFHYPVSTSDEIIRGDMQLKREQASTSDSLGFALRLLANQGYTFTELEQRALLLFSLLSDDAQKDVIQLLSSFTKDKSKCRESTDIKSRKERVLSVTSLDEILWLLSDDSHALLEETDNAKKEHP